MKKIINPWRNHEGYNCFGCSPNNPIGLHLEFYEDGDYIVSTWHPEHNYQGWVDTMHGGILSTLIDEVLVYINAQITNSKGELCNEGEAVYFLMNQEKAKEMGFLHCDVEE